MFTRSIGLTWQFQTPKTGWLCLKQARNHKHPIRWSQTMPASKMVEMSQVHLRPDAARRGPTRLRPQFTQ